MHRLVLEIAAIVACAVLGLEAVHYRKAVIESNLDRKRAWNTVIELRHSLETCVASGKLAPDEDTR
jgi:hypothetical protein